MAKIKFVVKELNKPSQFALSNLSQVVYNTITTKDTCNVEKDVTTKLNSATEVEKLRKEFTSTKATVKFGSL